MDFYFSSQAPASSNIQANNRFQPTMFPGSHNPTLNYFNNSHAKQSSLFQEDSFPLFGDADSHETGNFSPSEFTSFDNIGHSPLYVQPHFEKEHFSDNFNFSLDLASFKNEADNFSFERFQYPKNDSKLNTTDDMRLYNQGFKTEKQLEASQTSQDFDYEHQEQPEVAPVTTNILKSGVGMKGWSEDDEKLLRKLVVQYKFDWKKIAKKFDNKKYTPHFLKMRYRGQDEGPVPKRVKFSHEEDMQIAKYFNEYGVDWEKMVSHFPNRTPVMLKNRYYSHIRKNKKLENLLKELQDHESSHVSQCMSQAGDRTELSATSNEDHFSEYAQFQTEVFIDLNEKKDGEKKSKKNEVDRLKAQLKSLKSLYAATYSEILSLRGHQEAI